MFPIYETDNKVYECTEDGVSFLADCSYYFDRAVNGDPDESFALYIRKGFDYSAEKDDSYAFDYVAFGGYFDGLSGVEVSIGRSGDKLGAIVTDVDGQFLSYTPIQPSTDGYKLLIYYSDMVLIVGSAGRQVLYVDKDSDRLGVGGRAVKW